MSRILFRFFYFKISKQNQQYHFFSLEIKYIVLTSLLQFAQEYDFIFISILFKIFDGKLLFVDNILQHRIIYNVK